MAKKKPPAKLYDWDEALRDDLEIALMEFKLHPLLGQIEALEALAGYLRYRVVPGELLEPIESIYTELIDRADALTTEYKPGPRPAPLSERIVGARAAGTVTVLKVCGWKVGEAIKKVAGVTGLDADWLRYFRDEIHRGRAEESVRKIYDTHVADFLRDQTQMPREAQWTREELASYVLDVCAKYYATGRPFRRRFDL
jgi:hypothetical protein